MWRAALAALAALVPPAVVAAPAGGAPAPGAATPQAESAVRWALSQVGVRERGESNCGGTVERWQRRAGWRVPPCHKWCGAFVHEAFLQAGLDLPSSFLRPEDVLDDARAHRRGLRAIPIRQVRRGDLVIYRWGTTPQRADHFGIATRRLAPGATMVRTVDGNSGNAVNVSWRSLRYVVTAVRVVSPGS
jgi:cell wall-associated NlpC family hydrolase